KIVKHQGEGQDTFDNLLAFARAAALDKLGRYSEAWAHLVPANRSVFLATQPDLAYVLARQCANLVRLQQTRAKLGDDKAEDRPTSLFILGPSRSGKTTMEMLVSTLDDIKRGYENLTVRKAVNLAFEAGGLPADPLLESLPTTLHSMCRT